MSDNNDNDNDFEIIELEDELDEKLIEEFAEGIEQEINEVFKRNLDKDGRQELVNVLMSLAASLSLDMEVSSEEFLELASLFYEESERAEEELNEYDKYRLN